MPREKSRSQILVSIVLLFLVLINYPFLSIFNRSSLVFGVPLLYFYIFTLWAFLIIFLIVFLERK
jgi:hypothetical protein